MGFNIETLFDLFNQSVEMKETCAIINYFRLQEQILLSNLYTNSYNPNIDDKEEYKENLFRLIGGVESFNQLIFDCREGNIDIFSNRAEELILKLEENLKVLEDTLSEEAIKMIEFIIKKYKYWKSNDSIKSGPNAYASLDEKWIPVSRDKKIELGSLKPQQKKIGER